MDTEPAAVEVEKLLAKLQNGHVLLTSRRSDWSAAVAPLALDVLAEDDAVAFLLERTASRRRKTPEDGTHAHILTEELGGLALALEQAGAYIAKHRLRFQQYLDQWQSNRTKVLEWYDERLMQYPRSVAVTWQTSFDQLDEPARRLLQWLAWLAPEPIPESLLDTPVPEQPPTDLHAALAELEGYSLVARSAESLGFTVHRLVQDVTRRQLDNKARPRALAESLGWIDAAFIGNPQDVQSWSILESLIPHARKVADYADDAGITEPTARLMNQLGLLLHTKAQYAEAEPLYRRALAIDEASYGPDHPSVATRLNNLALLLEATNRLAEAEPLMRRVLAIDEASYGPEHPYVATTLNNLAELLRATNRLAEAEPLYRRALAIDEAGYEPDHPEVAIHLNNLALLLEAINRLAEAEPLFRRAVTIFLDFTHRTGHTHPHLQTVINNYHDLLKAMGKSEAEIRAEIDESGAESRSRP